MLRRFFLLFVMFIVLFSCQKTTKQINANQHKSADNHKPAIVVDSNFRFVNNAINSRDTSKLLTFLSSSDSLLREQAILGLASIGDTLHLYKIAQLLQDSSANVRAAAAFALGISRKSYVQDFLIKQFYNEPSAYVRGEILEALGRCGDSQGLYILSKMNISPQDTQEVLGLAYGLLHFSLRDITTDLATKQVIKILECRSCSTKAKIIASYYLFNRKLDLRPYLVYLLNLFERTDNRYLKANLLKILGRFNARKAKYFVQQYLNSDDILLRRAAFSAYLSANRFGQKELIKYLNSSDPVIARLTADYFVYNGSPDDDEFYFQIAKKLRNWQARALIFHAALKYSNDSMRPIIERSIISGYRAAANIYEKAQLLSAFSYDPLEFGFVRDQTFYTTNRVISTAGIKTLVKMRYNPHFAQFARQFKQEQYDNLYQEFRLIFKEAMLKGDNAMIFYTANILKNKRLNLIRFYDNTFFINQALSKLQLPRDVRVYLSVCQLLQVYSGDSCKTKNVELTPIDWASLDKYGAYRKVIVRTSKGDFVIQLNTEQAPAAVAAFLGLVVNNYYDNTYIYRLVPNKFVMASSRRGDGWQDENIVNNVHLTTQHFEPGDVAMQLIDKRLESVQWLITLSYSPQLDGKYTKIGKVVKGLDVVEKLDVSDQIFSIELL